MKTENSTGAAAMLSTALFFSFMALFVRLSSQVLSAGMISFTRYTVATVFVFSLMKFRPSRPVNVRLTYLRAISASVSGIFYFFALSSITLAEAVILKFTYPFFAVAFVAILYREKTSPYILFLLLISLTGVVIMANPGDFSINTGYIWGLLAGVTAGSSVAFARKLRSTDDPSTIMLYTSFAGVIISFPLLGLGVSFPYGMTFIYLMLAALAGLTAQYAMVYGIKYIKAGNASVLMMIEVVLTGGFGFLLLGDRIGYSQFAGGVIILLSGLLLILKENHKRKIPSL